jgi:replication-associated recombination protein RarA
VWIVKEWIAATMQQFVLMVDEVEQFSAAKQHVFVPLF